jgi:hypothetical protein
MSPALCFTVSAQISDVCVCAVREACLAWLKWIAVVRHYWPFLRIVITSNNGDFVLCSLTARQRRSSCSSANHGPSSPTRFHRKPKTWQTIEGTLLQDRSVATHAQIEAQHGVETFVMSCEDPLFVSQGYLAGYQQKFQRWLSLPYA